MCISQRRQTHLRFRISVNGKVEELYYTLYIARNIGGPRRADSYAQYSKVFVHSLPIVRATKNFLAALCK